FVLNGKRNKTCATCLTNKAKTRADKKTIHDDNQIIETILLNDLNEYVIELMDTYAYKESNRPRMEHFNCYGTLIINIDMPATK
ncbi:12188_t:CDS:2, partial [Racocetra fulgida]